MLGIIIGDMVGSHYEFHNHKSKDFEFWDSNCKMTDDSVCSIALAEHYLTGEDWTTLLRRRCLDYKNVGFGGMFKQWMYDDSIGPYNSWGNGGAMRTGPVAYVADTAEEVLLLAFEQCSITHSHNDGIEGAQAIALAMHYALQGYNAEDIMQKITMLFYYDLSVSLDNIRPTYKFDVSAKGSVPIALRAVLEATSFEDAIRNAISVGGDSDTIAAMTGGIAEILFGIPEDHIDQAASLLPQDRLEIVEDFYYKSII